MKPMLRLRHLASSPSDSGPRSVPATDDLARGRAVDAGDQVQQRGLARARRPHQRHELALGHVQVDAVEHLDLQAVALIDLANVLHADGGGRGRASVVLINLSRFEIPLFKYSGATQVAPDSGPQIPHRLKSVGMTK